MQAQLHPPLRIALAVFALGGIAIAAGWGGTLLTQSCLVGSLSLLALAAWPSRAPTLGRYGLPLLLLTPLAAAQVQDSAAALRLLLTGLGLGLWAGLGLRRPKKTQDHASGLGVWRLLGVLGLFALWSALGFMGGTLSTLVWSGDPQASHCLAASGVYTVIYHHARFGLQSPPSDSGPRSVHE